MTLIEGKRRAITSPFSVVLYVLAGIVVLAGLWIAISFFNAQNALFPAMMAFHGPMFNAIWGQIINLLRGIGITVLVISLLLAGALAWLGRLITQNARLKARVAELEAGVVSRQE